MKDTDRRRRFVAYFEETLKGDRAKLMEKTGLSKGRVTQLLDARQPFGERAAANLAEALHLIDDFFERDDHPRTGGGSLTEPLNPLPSASSSKKKRLKVAEIVRAHAGGSLVSVPQAKGATLGFVEAPGVDDDTLVIRVRGDGLSPYAEDGDFLLVRRDGPCAAGSRVIIESHTGDRVCKRLMIERPDAVVVTDLVTREQTTLERTQIKRMLKITGTLDPEHWRPE